jgi:hypothetical protein
VSDIDINRWEYAFDLDIAFRYVAVNRTSHYCIEVLTVPDSVASQSHFYAASTSKYALNRYRNAAAQNWAQLGPIPLQTYTSAWDAAYVYILRYWNANWKSTSTPHCMPRRQKNLSWTQPHVSYVRALSFLGVYATPALTPKAPQVYFSQPAHHCVLTPTGPHTYMIMTSTFEHAYYKRSDYKHAHIMMLLGRIELHITNGTKCCDEY